MTFNLPILPPPPIGGTLSPIELGTEPFAYRRGMSMQLLVESLREYVTGIFADWVRTNFESIDGSYDEIGQKIDDGLAAFTADLNAKFADLLNDVISANVPISDPIIRGAFQAANSLSYAWLSTNLLSPAPIDVRVIESPRFDPKDAAGRFAPGTDINIAKRNLWRYTEDIGQSFYSVQNATKNANDTINVNGMTLRRFSGGNFYSSLATNFDGNGFNLFVAGRYYLFSFYVFPITERDVQIIMRALGNSNSYGHGKRILQPGKLTRVSDVKKATSATQLASIDNPAGGYTYADATWFMVGAQSPNPELNDENFEAFIGGFQIEEISASGRFNIAAIGDSTIEGGSGDSDLQGAYESVSYFESLLNTHVFNFGNGGERTDAMDSRWASTMGAAAPVCRYAFIQGGVNDLMQGRSVADIQGSIMSMNNKAVQGGMTPIIFTVSPSENIVAAGQEANRQALNKWIKTQFTYAFDLAAVVQDPLDPSKLRRTPGGTSGWYGDGTHYNRGAKRAIAEALANKFDWDLPQASPYQAVIADTRAPSGILMTSPDGTRYRLTVANGGTVTIAAM